MTTGIVSICIPTYNRPQLISELLDSILLQTYQNFEIFITDNSTNADTKDLIRARYKDPRISYFKNDKNLGMDGNTLQVLKLVNGDYFTFTPDDDIWIDPNKLEKQIDLLNRNPSINICFTNVVHINYDGTKHKQQFKSKVKLKESCEVVDSSSLLLTNKNRDFVNILTAVLRIDLLDIFKESWKYGSEEYFMWYLGGTGQLIGFCYQPSVAHRDGEHNWDISDGNGNLVNYRNNVDSRANQIASIYFDIIKKYDHQLKLFNAKTEQEVCQILIDLIGLKSLKYRKNFQRISSISYFVIYLYSLLKHIFKLSSGTLRQLNLLKMFAIAAVKKRKL